LVYLVLTNLHRTVLALNVNHQRYQNDFSFVYHINTIGSGAKWGLISKEKKRPSQITFFELHTYL